MFGGVGMNPQISQLRKGVDVVFANEDEARALFQRKDSYENYARELAGFGGIAASAAGPIRPRVSSVSGTCSETMSALRSSSSTTSSGDWSRSTHSFICASSGSPRSEARACGSAASLRKLCLSRATCTRWLSTRWRAAG